MKKIIALFSLIIGVVISVCAGNNYDWGQTVKGNGNVTKEERPVKSFDKINASSGVNVYLFQGEQEKIIVETDENIQECVIARVENGTLKCYIDCNLRKSTKLNVYVNFKNISVIKTSSGSDVFGETIISSESLKLKASSGSDIKLEINAGELTGSASSGADIVLKGKADRSHLSASSGADIKASDLSVRTCKASASSAGDVRVRVTEELNASASSGGDVIYYGNPDKVRENESSGGDVKQR